MRTLLLAVMCLAALGACARSSVGPSLGASPGISRDATERAAGTEESADLRSGRLGEEPATAEVEPLQMAGPTAAYLADAPIHRPGAGAGAGRVRARRDIADGRPFWLFIGKPRFDVGDLHAATGLPKASVGGVKSKRSSAYVEAYNGLIQTALQNDELQGLHLRHKVTTEAAMKARFSDGAGRSVKRAEVVALQAGSRHRVHLTWAAGRDEPRLLVEDLQTGDRFEPYAAHVWRDVRILLDHDGTTLYIASLSCYQSWDLPSRRYLQGFGTGQWLNQVLKDLDDE